MECPYHVIMDSADTGQRVKSGMAFEDRDAVAGATQSRGCHHARRAMSDDHDIVHGSILGPFN